MAKLIRDLWSGAVPLNEVVWWYAVGYGLAVNLIATLLFLALFANEAAAIFLIIAFALPIPFNLFVVLAVWRSADRYEGPRKWADLARVGTVLWMIVLTAA